MTSKERKLKAIIELAVVQGRIQELNRTKSYLTNSAYYRKRLAVLEETADKLQDVLDNKEKKEVRLTFSLPKSVFAGKTVNEPSDIIQFLKREYLIEI